MCTCVCIFLTEPTQYCKYVCLCVLFCAIEVLLMSVLLSSFVVYFVLSVATNWIDTGNNREREEIREEME